MPNDDQQHNDTAFHRTGITSPNGPLVKRIEVYLDETTFNAVLQLANKLDQVPGEVGRDQFFLLVHGCTYLEYVAKHQAQRRAAQLANQGQMRGALS